jgi:hypothetical protein
MRRYNHEITKNGRGMFFAGRLDLTRCAFRLGEVICPSGKRSPHERSDMRVAVLKSPGVASLTRATLAPSSSGIHVVVR